MRRKTKLGAFGFFISVIFAWGSPAFALDTNLTGTLDTNFGTSGEVITDVTDGILSTEEAEAVVVQSDGEIVVAGETSNLSLETDIVLLRYDTDGSLDTSFGTHGEVVTDTGSAEEIANDMALQADGEIVVAGTDGEDILVIRYESDGSLDTTFGGDGIVTVDVSDGQDEATAIAIQDDGEIVVVGVVDGGSGTEDIVVVRLDTDGSLDTAFSGDGIVTTNLGSGTDEAAAGIVIDDSDGEIFVVGTSDTQLAVVAYETDGDLDATFSTDGILLTDLDTAQAGANDVFLESDDTLLIAGYVENANGTETDAVLVRLNEDGSLDATFGTGGVTTDNLASGSDDQFTAVTVTTDGNILAAGDAVPVDATTNTDLIVVEYDDSGTLVADFGTGGTETTDVSGTADIVNDIALETNGDIVVVGGTNVGANERFVVELLNADGSLDVSFDDDGIVATDLGNTTETIAGLGLTSTGDIVAAGTSGDSMAVISYTSDGDLNTRFSADGILVVDVGTSSLGNDVTITTDDRIIVAGAARSDGASDLDAALVALNSDGSPDTSFSGDGVATVDLSADNDDQFTTLLVEEDDGTIVAGGDPIDPETVDNEAFNIVQFTADGSVDTSFGTNGIETIDFGTGDDSVNAVAEQSNGELISVGIAEDVDTSDEFFGIAATDTVDSDSGCNCNLNARPKPWQTMPQILMAAMLCAVWLILRRKV